MGSQRLLIFTRFPVPGQTKTRLIPALGAEGAANLQRQLTEHAVALAQHLTHIYPIAVTLFYTGGTEAQMQQWLGTGTIWDYAPQSSGDLGDRLQGAFQAAFDQGSEKVIVMGIDCPLMTVELLQTAFDALHNHDVVIGPALDGGYYLLGLKTPRPSYFQGIDWSTDRVYSQTLAKIQQTGDRPYSLPVLPDLDRPSDLDYFLSLSPGQSFPFHKWLTPPI